MKRKAAIYSILIIITLFGFLLPSAIAESGSQINTISPQTAADLIERHRGDANFIILDIRTPAEFQAGHLAGALLIDFYSQTFAGQIDRLDRNRTYLVYCRSGNRSGRSLELFKKLKFQHIYNMATGIKGWRAQGLPSVK